MSELKVLSIKTCVTPCIRTSVTLCLQDLLEGAGLGPPLPAAAPGNASIVADDRSPARTCAGSLPAVLLPLPPRERVVGRALHTRTIVGLPRTARPSRSALAPCSPTDIPTLAAWPDSSANSRDSVLRVMHPPIVQPNPLLDQSHRQPRQPISVLRTPPHAAAVHQHRFRHAVAFESAHHAGINLLRSKSA